MVWQISPLWQRIIFYAFIFIALFIYVKLSQIEFMGVKLISLKNRILLALFFPLIFVVFFLLGSIIFALILAILFIILIFSLFSRGRIKYRRIRL